MSKPKHPKAAPRPPHRPKAAPKKVAATKKKATANGDYYA